VSLAASGATGGSLAKQLPSPSASAPAPAQEHPSAAGVTSSAAVSHDPVSYHEARADEINAVKGPHKVLAELRAKMEQLQLEEEQEASARQSRHATRKAAQEKERVAMSSALEEARRRRDIAANAADKSRALLQEEQRRREGVCQPVEQVIGVAQARLVENRAEAEQNDQARLADEAELARLQARVQALATQAAVAGIAQAADMQASQSERQWGALCRLLLSQHRLARLAAEAEAFERELLDGTGHVHVEPQGAKASSLDITSALAPETMSAPCRPRSPNGRLSLLGVEVEGTLAQFAAFGFLDEAVPFPCSGSGSSRGGLDRNEGSTSGVS